VLHIAPKNRQPIDENQSAFFFSKTGVMNLGFSENAPPCDKKACFGYADGVCRVLVDTRFKRGCPFFKDKEAKKAEDAFCSQRAKIWKNSRKKGRKTIIFGGEIR